MSCAVNLWYVSALCHNSLSLKLVDWERHLVPVLGALHFFMFSIGHVGIVVSCSTETVGQRRFTDRRSLCRASPRLWDRDAASTDLPCRRRGQNGRPPFLRSPATPLIFVLSLARLNMEYAREEMCTNPPSNTKVRTTKLTYYSFMRK